VLALTIIGLSLATKTNKIMPLACAVVLQLQLPQLRVC
jgi:hypothetical protein